MKKISNPTLAAANTDFIVVHGSNNWHPYAYGQVSDAERKVFSTPDKVQTTRFGTLQFKDGVPDAATTQKLYDELDYIHAVDAL